MEQEDTQDWLDELIDVINTELTDLEDDDERDKARAGRALAARQTDPASARPCMGRMVSDKHGRLLVQ
jgi:hypothetical protein